MTELTSGDVVSIDPSIRSVGVALWRNGKLRRAKRITVEDVEMIEDPAARWIRVAYRIIEFVADCKHEVHAVIFERPQIYGGPSEVDQNDLLGLAGVGGAVAMGLSVLRAHQNVIVRVHSVLPREWSRGLPKIKKGNAWESPRGRQIWARLDETERACAPAQHDAVDAVGIGLFAIGRFEPIHVMPGAV